MEISTSRHYSIYNDGDTRNGIKVTYGEDRRSFDEEDKVVEITIEGKSEDVSVVLDASSFCKLMQELKYIEGVL